MTGEDRICPPFRKRAAGIFKYKRKNHSCALEEAAVLLFRSLGRMRLRMIAEKAVPGMPLISAEI